MSPAKKTATARARIEPGIKKKAESIFRELGLSVSTAVELFYRQTIANGGLPFALRVAGQANRIDGAVSDVSHTHSSSEPASQDLRGKHILITAGPTCEDIDPVRFLTNRSSGRMGVALAAAAALRGADVDFIHGPLHVPVPRIQGLKVVPVRSARDMHRAVMRRIRRLDIAIMAAAVADFTPARRSSRKIKKAAGGLTQIELVPTVDILGAVGRMRNRPFLVGFAAETEHMARNAREKLRRKNCDMVCANNVAEAGSGFGTDTNRITIFRRGVRPVRLPLLSKEAVAERILDAMIRQMGKTP